MGFNIDELPGGLSYAKLSQVLTDSGYVSPAYQQNVPGLVGGQTTYRQPLVSANRRIAVGLATKLFDYQFSAASQNTAIWKCLFTTMTMTQSAGALLLNANSTATTTTGCLLSTWRYFNFPGNGTVSIEMEVQFTATPLTNQMFIGGIYPTVSATALPTDGAYFKFSSSGLVGVANFAGTETVTSVLIGAGTMLYNQNYNLKIDVSNSGIDFWINDTLLATLLPASANPTPFNWGALPLTLQQYNPGTVSGSPQMQVKVGSCTVTQRDLATEKLWENQQGLSGLNANQGSEGGTMGTTALYSNSLVAGAGAVMTNTTAALTAGFGGQFTHTGALAAGTDGILQSYQNPAGTINQIPRSILIKGVWIQSAVSATITGGPMLMAYSLAFGHTNVSLATAETGTFVTATTKAPRRIALGFETIAATSATGVIGAGVYRTFSVPIVINPGEFVAICAKNLGTVMSGGTITSLVGFDACYE